MKVIATIGFVRSKPRSGNRILAPRVSVGLYTVAAARLCSDPLRAIFFGHKPNQNPNPKCRPNVTGVVGDRRLAG